MHILLPRLNSDVSQVACPLFFYTPLVLVQPVGYLKAHKRLFSLAILYSYFVSFLAWKEKILRVALQYALYKSKNTELVLMGSLI